MGQYFPSETFFEKYQQKYRGTAGGTFDLKVPSTGTAHTFNKVPSTGTAGTLKKYRAHLWLLLLLQLTLQYCDYTANF